MPGNVQTFCFFSFVYANTHDEFDDVEDDEGEEMADLSGKKDPVQLGC